MGELNPKILHRIYFDDMAPFRDPFLRYLDTWKREMSDYKIMYWNAKTFNFPNNIWCNKCLKAQDPVFLSEYMRWKVLSMYGGMYLDADCEILNGKKLNALIDQLYSTDEYDCFCGVEDKTNGYPTAQTFAAKKGSALVSFMLNLYDGPLSSALWYWRQERGLIGPQLISLYFREKGFEDNHGFFVNLESPIVRAGVKVYTQDYFSPKFTTTGKTLFETDNTCVYHLFSNLNMQKVDPERQKHRDNPLLYKEYCEYLRNLPKNEQQCTVRDSAGNIRIKRLLRMLVMHPFIFTKKVVAFLIRRW